NCRFESTLRRAKRGFLRNAGSWKRASSFRPGKRIYNRHIDGEGRMTRCCATILVTAAAVLGQQPASLYPAAREGGGGNYMFNYYIPPAPSSTPWAPAWSPDGKSIAVSMQGSIWRIDLSTGVATELTSNARYHSSPTWSADGRWIVYTAENDGKDIQLEILNVSTGETRALTADDHLYLDPAFSPDGTRLCYVSTRPDGRFNIFIRAIH